MGKSVADHSDWEKLERGKQEAQGGLGARKGNPRNHFLTKKQENVETKKAKNVL